MRRLRWTRQAKILTGSLVVVFAAGLLAFSFMGLPISGALAGTAVVDKGRDSRGPYFDLDSGFLGLQTGFILLKNNTKNMITLQSYKQSKLSELWGWDTLKPGEQKKFDFKGHWNLYYFNGEPTIVDCETSGGGGIEGGLRMGPNGYGPIPLGSDKHGNYLVAKGLAAVTRVIGLRNDSNETVKLASYYQSSVEWSGPGEWTKWGEDSLKPGEAKRFDFTRDIWRIYYTGALPIVDYFAKEGGGAGEGGLRMGPYGGR
ncbi:MAG: hypothetical protein ACOX87_14225 [Chloroflexota bacterium]|jgi:hypothetical protein